MPVSRSLTTKLLLLSFATMTGSLSCKKRVKKFAVDTSRASQVTKTAPVSDVDEGLESREAKASELLAIKKDLETSILSVKRTEKDGTSGLSIQVSPNPLAQFKEYFVCNNTDGKCLPRPDRPGVFVFNEHFDPNPPWISKEESKSAVPPQVLVTKIRSCTKLEKERYCGDWSEYEVRESSPPVVNNADQVKQEKHRLCQEEYRSLCLSLKKNYRKYHELNQFKQAGSAVKLTESLEALAELDDNYACEVDLKGWKDEVIETEGGDSRAAGLIALGSVTVAAAVAVLAGTAYYYRNPQKKMNAEDRIKYINSKLDEFDNLESKSPAKGAWQKYRHKSRINTLQNQIKTNLLALPIKKRAATDVYSGEARSGGSSSTTLADSETTASVVTVKEKYQNFLDLDRLESEQYRPQKVQGDDPEFKAESYRKASTTTKRVATATISTLLLANLIANLALAQTSLSIQSLIDQEAELWTKKKECRAMEGSL